MKSLPRIYRQPVLKPVYSTAELALTMGVSRYLVQQLLRSQGLVLYRVGKVTLVPLTEIRDKLAPVWEAICLGEKMSGLRKNVDFAQIEQPEKKKGASGR